MENKLAPAQYYKIGNFSIILTEKGMLKVQTFEGANSISVYPISSNTVEIKIEKPFNGK